MTEPQPRLDILVIEDTLKHRESAQVQLKEHKLVVLTNYEEGQKALESGYHYNVLLTDLMMPKGGRSTMGPEGMKYIFDLLPFGFPLAFLAAKIKIPYIGIVTDINHHDHPISAAIDPISGGYWRDSSSEQYLYTINDSKLGIFHAPFTDDGRKDWNKVLEVLQK
ncbi:response regulator [Candidatus Woesearchaeota archaeon]|nr:response regulator [Candidatus Woesearchaeota archaeon]